MAASGTRPARSHWELPTRPPGTPARWSTPGPDAPYRRPAVYLALAGQCASKTSTVDTECARIIIGASGRANRRRAGQGRDQTAIASPHWFLDSLDLGNQSST